jgi:hypothetical protein
VRLLRAFGAFWYDFLIGDDWKIAAVVVTVLAVGAAVVAAGARDPHVLTAVLALAIAAAFTLVLLIDVRSSRR